MTLLDVVTALLSAGLCSEPCEYWDALSRAEMIADACGEDGDPWEWPSGDDCKLLLVAVWQAETAGTLAERPTYRGTGSGPGQVVAGRLWTTRTGDVWTPSRLELEEPAVGLRWAVELLRWKAWRLGTRNPAMVLRAYNASDAADAYVARAMRVLVRAGR